MSVLNLYQLDFTPPKKTEKKKTEQKTKNRLGKLWHLKSCPITGRNIKINTLPASTDALHTIPYF